jgi:hypothetical protein
MTRSTTQAGEQPAKPQKIVTDMAGDWIDYVDPKTAERFKSFPAAFRQRNRIPGKPQLTEAAIAKLTAMGEEFGGALTKETSRKLSAHMERAGSRRCDDYTVATRAARPVRRGLEVLSSILRR